MPSNQIVVNEEYLRRLQTEYAAYVDDIDKFHGKIFSHGSLPESKMDITQPFTLRLGGKGFAEAADMGAALDRVRTGLAERIRGARDELDAMEHGIKFLLADSNATEQMGTLTAEQFDYFMPGS